MNERRVLILPPSRRDALATGELMQRAGLDCCVCDDAPRIAEELESGAGVLLLTDAALTHPKFQAVTAALARQPQWSDLPIVVLCPAGPQSGPVARMLGSLSNVTVLDRPASARTLLSALLAAMRSRLRQYQIRDQLEALSVAQTASKEAQEALRVADRRKDEFLAMLAHELRNPLAPIRNASELLERRLPQDPLLQQASGIVKRQILHLSRLVDDLLDVSRITQGRIELQHRHVDLAQVIAHAMESVEPLLREKRHKVYLSTRYGPLFVSGDHARLVQCIGNILTNSAKYTDPGGEIRVDVHRENGHVVIAISDNGIGIPEELLTQVFELFVQNERALDRSQGGLGIGLSVVQRLIEMHGGTVTANSGGPGRGSRFEVRLPLTAAPHAARPEQAAETTAPKRILIVDDNVDAADSLALLLTLSGHAVETVYEPRDALKRASDFAPDVILLDIGLPGLDGYEVARRVRADGNAARLVALTGYGQPEDVRRTREAGFDSHLVKPVELQSLLRSLG